MKNFFRSCWASLALVASIAAQPALAQVDSVTTTPTKVYAVVGGNYSFSTSYTSASGSSTTDLLVGYTANTSGASIVPYASCIDAATPAPYDGAQPNTKYVNWDAGIAFFPSAAACGSQSTVTLATFTGTVASFPVGGAFTVTVWNNNASGANNVAANDVTVCQKRTVQSVTPPANFTEGGSGTFTITLDAAVATGCGGFSVPFALSGPAVAGKSATPTSGTCTFADGATSCVTGAISTSQNVIIDGNMALTLTVTDSVAGDAYVSTGSKAGTVTVLDDEVGASVAATAQASETGPTNGVVTFTRTGSTAASLNLTSAISGTATYTADYSLTAGTCAIVTQSASSITVTVPAASASCTLNVVPVDDLLVEGPETVVFGIPTGVGVAGTGSAATITITDNDTPPVFSVAKAGACAEPSTNCTFTITRDSGVASATTVNFTTTGTATRSTTGAAGSGDYYLALTACAPANVIAANSVSHPDANPLVINMCVLDDLAVEGTETATLTLTANPPTYTVGTATQTQNIADDDSPQTVTVAVTGSPATETGGVLTYTFTRAGGSAAAQAATLAVNITPPAVSGRYSTTCTSPQTFAAATSTKTCTVTGIPNAVLDGNVNVVVGVAAPSVASDYTVGSPATATGVIADDEVGVSVAAVSGVITEGGLATFTVSCTGAATTSVPFTLTGTVASDVIGGATSPIALTCGTSQTVTVQTQQNLVSGDARSITLTLGTPTGGNAALTPGQSAAIVSVLDDDAPKVVPTMSALGLGLMGLMLAGLVAFQRRRSLK